MASDISSILGNELKNTFESLLSLNAAITSINASSAYEITGEQCIRVVLSMNSSSVSGKISFYLPALISTKFEYFMLGGIGDLKAAIDDEILDAVKEIINTIGGGLATSINAQDFSDLQGVSFSQESGDLLDVAELGEIENLYKVDLTFNDEELDMFIAFDDNIVPFMGKVVSGEDIDDDSDDATIVSAPGSGGSNSILSLLGAESVDNLKLLFNVKLKFSVRLGTKTFLLKDIVNWDIGHIIELEQMVNEPLDILVNGTKVGEGEAVIVEGRFGIKIRTIGEKQIEV